MGEQGDRQKEGETDDEMEGWWRGCALEQQ